MAKNNKTLSSSYKRPGRLNGKVTFTLHTGYAQSLFLGFNTDNERSINLLQFAKQMTVIWNAAAKNDPYADWYLLKVFDATLRLSQQLKAEIVQYKGQLEQASSLSNVNFVAFESEKPVTEYLWFKTQYGYMVAGLVATFDELMRLVLTINRIGLLLKKPEKTIQKIWFTHILSLFKLPFKWQDFSINREDVVLQHPNVSDAEKRMGKLPQLILSGELRSPFAPEIIVKPD